MFKLLGSELYRLLHKKSMYVYFGALAAGYFIISFIRSGGFREESVVNDAMTMFSLLPALAGGFLFSAIYTDDLNSKKLISLVGYGVSKAVIVMTKFVLIALLGVIVFGLTPLYHCAIYTVLGQTITADMTAMIYAVSLKNLLAVVAYAALSGVVVYGLQRATFAIVTYLLLAFGVIGGLVSVALNTFAPKLLEYLISGISDKILLGLLTNSPLITPFIEYVIYVLISLALSVVAFYRKEMEF